METTLYQNSRAVFIPCPDGDNRLIPPALQYDGCWDMHGLKISQATRAPVDNDLVPYTTHRTLLNRMLYDVNPHLTDLLEIPLSEVYWVTTTTLSFESNHHISYPVRFEDCFNRDRRRKVKFSKWLERCMSYKLFALTDAEASALCQKWSRVVAEYFPLYTFHLESGFELQTCYKNGPSSCMRGSSAIRLYAENPDKVQIVRIAVPDNPYKGRALLWTLDNGSRFLDRIYPDDDGTHITALQDYARQQGWYWRGGGLGNRTIYAPDGSIADSREFEATLKNVDAWPYVDTLYLIKEGYDDSPTITLSASCNDAVAELQSTDGDNPFADETVVCESCSCRVPPDDLQDYTITNSRGYAHSESLCESCSEELSYCENCERYAEEDATVVVNIRASSRNWKYTERTICVSCCGEEYTAVNGEYYPTDDVTSCVSCDELCLVSGDYAPYCSEDCIPAEESEAEED